LGAKLAGLSAVAVLDVRIRGPPPIPPVVLLLWLLLLLLSVLLLVPVPPRSARRALAIICCLNVFAHAACRRGALLRRVMKLHGADERR